MALSILTNTIPLVWSENLVLALRQTLDSSAELWVLELYEPPNKSEWSVVLRGMSSGREWRQSFDGAGEHEPSYIASALRQWLGETHLESAKSIVADIPAIGERLTLIEKRGYWRRTHWSAEGERTPLGRWAPRDEPSLQATFLLTGERDRDGYRVLRSDSTVSPEGVAPSDWLAPPAPIGEL